MSRPGCLQAAAEKNGLDTGTLGFSNIENRAEYQVEHQSAGISSGGSVGGERRQHHPDL
ncbi:hypothetical protein ACFL9S_22855 [Erwinia sp. AnSW2-5]|uniref:hypothetical protein n=1 Tax=Erwinia sp. AnSW2-5 TaxID=3367692 RepID=UPI00385893BE